MEDEFFKKNLDEWVVRVSMGQLCAQAFPPLMFWVRHFSYPPARQNSSILA
jgi:hypothetical protein